MRSESGRVWKNAGCIGHYPLRTRRVFFSSDRNSRSESARDECTVFRVPDNLDGDMLSRLVIQCSDHLSETSLADHLQDLVSECTQVSSNLHTCEKMRHGSQDAKKDGKKSNYWSRLSSMYRSFTRGENSSSSIFTYRFAIYRSLPRAFRRNCTRSFQPQFLLSRE